MVMGARKGTYKVRQVVKQVNAKGVQVTSYPQKVALWDVLECGHAIRFREPQSTAEAVRMIFNHGKSRKRRCFVCVSGNEGYYQHIDWSTATDATE